MENALDPLKAAQRRAALWQVPLVTDAEAAELLGDLPTSTWAMVRKQPDAPREVWLGRRLHFRTDDLRAFVDGRAGRERS